MARMELVLYRLGKGVDETCRLIPFDKYAIKNTIIPAVAICQSHFSNPAAAIANKAKSRVFLRLLDISIFR